MGKSYSTTMLPVTHVGHDAVGVLAEDVGDVDGVLHGDDGHEVPEVGVGHVLASEAGEQAGPEAAHVGHEGAQAGVARVVQVDTAVANA